MVFIHVYHVYDKKEVCVCLLYTTIVYSMHTQINTYSDLLIDYFILRMILTCRKLVMLTGSGKENGRSGVEERGLRVVCLFVYCITVFTI